MNAHLLGIPFDRVNDYWPFIVDQLERARKRGDGWTLEQVHEGLLNRDMQLWVVMQNHQMVGVGITEIRIGKEKMCHILALAGVGWDTWKHTLETVKDWARSQECQKITMKGRPGWLKRLDWKLTQVELELDLWVAQTDKPPPFKNLTRGPASSPT